MTSRQFNRLIEMHSGIEESWHINHVVEVNMSGNMMVKQSFEGQIFLVQTCLREMLPQRVSHPTEKSISFDFIPPIFLMILLDFLLASWLLASRTKAVCLTACR